MASRPGHKGPSYVPKCIYVPLPEVQVSQGQEPPQCEEMVPLLISLRGKIFNGKNPTENLEEVYLALK